MLRVRMLVRVPSSTSYLMTINECMLNQSNIYVAFANVCVCIGVRVM